MENLHPTTTTIEETHFDEDNIRGLLHDALGFTPLDRNPKIPEVVRENVDIGLHNDDHDDEFDDRAESNAHCPKPLPTIDPTKYQKMLDEFETLVLNDMSLAQAHRYVLLNHKKVTPYREYFLNYHKSLRNGHLSSQAEENLLVHEFPSWFRKQQGMDAFTGDVLHSFEHKHIVRACHFSEGNRENSTLTSAYDLTFYLCMVLILYFGGTCYETSFIEFLNYQFWVGSEHLLLGLLREGKGVAAS
ncbi:hypothetical protein ACFE04_007167 [Oxalis oulophora]